MTENPAVNKRKRYFLRGEKNLAKILDRLSKCSDIKVEPDFKITDKIEHEGKFLVSSVADVELRIFYFPGKIKELVYSFMCEYIPVPGVEYRDAVPENKVIAAPDSLILTPENQISINSGIAYAVRFLQGNGKKVLPVYLNGTELTDKVIAKVLADADEKNIDYRNWRLGRIEH
ncbi:hypothetical protein KY346_06030 [Candidatus Woesearchaeota archaeon]|nr:hypothetical protein [Candidatus Woesearchaeota archaeon]